MRAEIEINPKKPLNKEKYATLVENSRLMHQFYSEYRVAPIEL